MKKAILFGASGFIGGYLLDELLNNPEYDQVTVVVRKALSAQHPKLKTVIGDYFTLPGLKAGIEGSEVFIALGTTKANTPDKKQYYLIDHDYPVLAAQLARQNGATAVFMVSSVGADAESGVFYLKTKGEAERDIIALDFDQTHIFRPSMLMGSRKENRPLEKLILAIWPVVNSLLIGKRLSKFKGIEGRDVAKAMISASKKNPGKVNIYQWREMKDLVNAVGRP